MVRHTVRVCVCVCVCVCVSLCDVQGKLKLSQLITCDKRKMEKNDSVKERDTYKKDLRQRQKMIRTSQLSLLVI